MINMIRLGIEASRQALDTAIEVRFDPGRDTAVAFGTLLIFWPIYYIGSNVETIGAFLLFLIGGNLLVNVLLPVYYLVAVRKESLSKVGIKKEGWMRALGLSVLLTALFLPELTGYTDQYTISELVPHVISMGLILWEPLFVHGWLQIRYERAFGTIPAVLLGGGSFGLYHIGTYPIAGVVELAIFGCLFAVVFRIARCNLLVLWPLTWAVASSIGTLGQFEYDWGDAAIWLLLLFATAIGILLITRQMSSSPDLK